MKVRTFSSNNGVRFVLTSLDVPGFFCLVEVFGFFLFFLNLVILGRALFYLAVRESLTNLNSGISLLGLFLFKFK